ncbi:hypothetical protein [Cupriavidus pampae]|uniref:HK97 gp10 family phage protein n=1 Tax=Cupriavidus pampae TaxID=659251 RepID=A0ABN7ZIC3_9BURK|nr:hypothetical protein [Cupriavidus pampae]CAG9183854.1 hypothetical protein LMG32289_05443 [Cupriavidus pampae]
MNDFTRILTEIQTSEAEIAADVAIEQASKQAQRTEVIRYARSRFNEAGVGSYLQEQAGAMAAAHYWVKVYDNDLSDRVQTSIEFVPAPHELYEKGIGGPNTVTLHIVTWSDAAVKAEIYTGHSNNRQMLPATTIAELSLDHVRQWFQRFVEFAMNYQKERDARHR